MAICLHRLWRRHPDPELLLCEPRNRRNLPQDDPKQRRPDITNARTLLGWEPKVDLRKGLQLSLDCFRSEVNAERAASSQAVR